MPDRVLHVAGDGVEAVLPASLWPAGLDLGGSDPLFFSPITKKQANDLMAAWGGHPVGPYNRRFGYQAWGLAVRGTAAACAVSGSAPGVSAAGYSRFDCVDLARIARHPAHPGIMRVMLRLWRDYLGPEWAGAYWPVSAAVSYALPGRAGNLYRFDGWTFWGKVRVRRGPGSPRSRSGPSRALPAAEQTGDGEMGVWYYPYARKEAAADG